MAATKSGNDAPRRISVDGIDGEQFTRLVDLLADWISRREVKIGLLRPSAVVLHFDEDNIALRLRNGGLPEGCLSQLRVDIPLMLYGILAGYRTWVTRILMDSAAIRRARGAPKPAKEQIKAEVESRIQKVENKLVTLNLRREYAVKFAAKTDTYLDMLWEIVERQSDSGGSIIPRSFYATVQIISVRPRKLEPGHAFPGPSVSEFRGPEERNALVLTMTLRDLEDFAENLGKAAKALRDAEEADGGK